MSALNQLLSGSSREEDTDRKFSVSSRRSQQMQRVAEMELDEDGQHLLHYVWSFGLGSIERPAHPPMVTIQMASKADEDDGNGVPERKQRRKKMRAGLRYLRNAAIQATSNF